MQSTPGILPPPLIPTGYTPKANTPRRQRKNQTQIETERELDPLNPARKGRKELEPDSWEEIEKDVFQLRGNTVYYIRWKIVGPQLQRNVTPLMMRLLRNNLQKSFKLRHSFHYRLRNVEDAGELTDFYKRVKPNKNQNPDLEAWYEEKEANEYVEKVYIEYWRNPEGTSPHFKKFSEAEAWVNEREEERLSNSNIERPNTKWVFDEHLEVELKAIKFDTPLLGNGKLPDWLRKQHIISLDTYADNLCLWRCIAVHRGSYPNRSTQEAERLMQEYGVRGRGKTPLQNLDWIETNLNRGKYLSEWEGFRVYEPERAENEIKWNLVRLPPEDIKNLITIGRYGDHAFLIKDIEKLGKNFACAQCQARFTQSNNLQRHVRTCTKGKTRFNCPGEKVEAPQTAYEKAFYPKEKTPYSKESIEWLEYAAKRFGIQIDHAMSGRGGERWIEKAPVDGYYHKEKIIFQYHGCFWHGCVRCYPTQRDKPIVKYGNNKKISLEEKYQLTKRRTAQLKKEGYRVIEGWACKEKERRCKIPTPQSKTYPHAIFYDFESYGDKTKRKTPTAYLTIENEHVPISVSIGDTKETGVTHICEKGPKELIHKFMKEVERRGKSIREQVRKEFMPEDMDLLPQEQQIKIAEWCNQVPVVGFNSGKYDLNLIKAYFAGQLAEKTKPGKIRVAKAANKIMFITTPNYRFLDIINYVGPGVTYERWIKAYDCKLPKSWLPYEWFDSAEKLEYPGLPDYPHWYSKQKNQFVLKLSEWKECKKTFKERGMKTFKDWLEYYNNLDVGPGLEALQKMKAFYTEKGIDIMKDAVSIPGVSLHYLLSGAIKTQNADLHAPSEEAYKMLKAAVVGGPSLVFTRYHEVGKTKIRSHKYEDAKPCQKIQGYDANALYLSTMLREMPCGKEKVVNWGGTEQRYVEVDIEIPHWLHKNLEKSCPFPIDKKLLPAERGGIKVENIAIYEPLLGWLEENGAEILAEHRVIIYSAVEQFITALKEKSWFGFAEVDIKIPENLHEKFEEMCPFFYNKEVPKEAVPKHMLDYLEKTKRKFIPQKKLMGALSAEKTLLYAPLLEWYIDHGAEITKVHRTIDYQPAVIFEWFVNQVTEARRTGDVEKSKALLADIFKLLGNSGYGKLIEALERQSNVTYTRDEKVVARYMRSAYFEDITEIENTYELESRKTQITIRRPFQIGIAVYQLAKLRMLEFYYDFLDRYFDRKDFELIQMDTDSNYFAISGKKLEDIVKREMKAEFEKEKNNWLAWDKWSGRTPGLFKQEFEGERMIALCSKCYYADQHHIEKAKKKLSTKGMSHRQNSITWGRFKSALDGHQDMATNRGFRMEKGRMVTYEQEKRGLSAYYDKRWVLPDGIHTEPIEYHI